jgi:hypothetical protein
MRGAWWKGFMGCPDYLVDTSTEDPLTRSSWRCLVPKGLAVFLVLIYSIRRISKHMCTYVQDPNPSSILGRPFVVRLKITSREKDIWCIDA